MLKHKNLILLGYDYSISLLKMNLLENNLILIHYDDLKYFNKSHIKELRNLFKDKLILTHNFFSTLKCVQNKYSIDTIFSLGWRKIIDINKIINVKNLINIHPALLPEYKGYHPLPYVIANGEKFHGITAHFLTNELDGGGIILKENFKINSFSTIKTLQKIVNDNMKYFLEKLFTLVENGNIKIQDNNPNQTKIIAPRRKPSDSEVHLSDSVSEMFKKVKASDPDRFPAFFVYEGFKVYISLSRGDETKRDYEHDI